MQYLTLARHIYTELGLKRVAVLRVKQPLRPLWRSANSSMHRAGWAIRL